MSRRNTDQADALGGAIVGGFFVTGLLAYGLAHLVMPEHRAALIGVVLLIAGGFMGGFLYRIFELKMELKERYDLTRYLESLGHIGGMQKIVDTGLTRIATVLEHQREWLTKSLRAAKLSEASVVASNITAQVEETQRQFYARYDEHERFSHLTGITLRERDPGAYLSAAPVPHKPEGDVATEPEVKAS